MTILVDWGNYEETILVWKFSREWQTSHYMEALRQSNSLALTKAHQVNLICDIRMTTQRASNLMTLSRLVIQYRPANVDVMVIIVVNRFWKQMAEILTHQGEGLPVPVHFVETVDAAYALVEEIEEADSGSR
ncbi:MAG: hypothetical protein ACPG7F_04040 [Aggregatilineales bacterium]